VKTRATRTGLRWLAVIVMTLALMLSASQSVLPQEGPPKKYPLGDIPLDRATYFKYMKDMWSVDRLDRIEALPEFYDARLEGIVTPAKDQGNCGSCWAFASVGAVESHMLKAYGVGPEDLSEQQQVSCNRSMLGCRGGSSDAILYWQDTGPLDDACFPYTALDSTPCIEDQCLQLDFRVYGYHTLPVNTLNFQESLYNDGPSYWRYVVYSDFFDYWNTGEPGEVYVQRSGVLEGGHAVLLIGWDNDKGAFLCKNSWGESNGPNHDGTFWIAYSGHAHNLGFGMANFSVEPYVPDPCDACFRGRCDGSCNPKKEGPDCPDCMSGCSSDAECNDGMWCTGMESCVSGTCQGGTPVDCSDGAVCDEATQSCITQDNCNACFKGVCDGVCHPKKEGSDCPDCQ